MMEKGVFSTKAISEGFSQYWPALLKVMGLVYMPIPPLMAIMMSKIDATKIPI